MSMAVLPPAAFGVSGNTSAQALARMGQWALDDSVGCTAVPDLGVIYVGVNDPVTGLSQASTQANVQAMILSAKHGAYGDETVSGASNVATQASLPSGGRHGQRVVVLADGSTSGGAHAWNSEQAPTITGDFSGTPKLAVWEYRSRRAGEAGWGRIAVSTTAPTKCKRVVVVSTNYKNYAINGSDVTAAGSASMRDTTGTPEPWYAQVRAAQQAAVTAENSAAPAGAPWVVYADLYTLQRTLIAGGTFPASGSPTYSITAPAGTVPDFSGGAGYDATKDWHYTNSNQHHGQYGHELVAQSVALAVANVAQWLSDLRAVATVNVKCIGDSQTDLQAGYCRAARTWAPTLGRMLTDFLVT